jgi:hypothetical protein
MALLSPEDRARLALALETQLPDIQYEPLRNLFTIMLALLRDHEVLESLVRKHVDSSRNMTRDLSAMCHLVHDQMKSGGPG